MTGKARNLTAEANRGQSDLAKNLEAEDLVKAVYKKSNQAFLWSKWPKFRLVG